MGWQWGGAGSGAVIYSVPSAVYPRYSAVWNGTKYELRDGIMRVKRISGGLVTRLLLVGPLLVQPALVQPLLAQQDDVVIQPVSPPQRDDGKQREATKWKANSFPGFKFDDVAMAKVVTKDDAELVRIMKSGFDLNVEPVNVTVVEVHEQKRTRVVNVNGVEKERTYTVQVPVRTVKTVMQNVLAQQGERHLFPIGKVKVWDIDGIRLSTAQMRKSLETVKHVFLVTPKSDGSFSVDPYYQSVLNSEVLFVFANFPEPKPEPNIPLPPMRVRGGVVGARRQAVQP
jgi:hypothetical protein